MAIFMVETINSTSDSSHFTYHIYEVFEHLKMLQISSSVLPYTNTLMTVGPDFGKIRSG